MTDNQTIVALSTPDGVGAIGVIRLSGKESIHIINSIFKGKNLQQQPSHTIHLGTIHDKGLVIDEVLVSLFVAPKSYTKENVVEISCHGSPYIIQRIIELLITAGARPAQPGEFTLRAFLNGGLDLSQAEAVADLIASKSQLAHQIALQQMRGGFSNQLKTLREELIHFASLIELELDFSEEDVEFANRSHLHQLIGRIQSTIHQLIISFEQGNVIKNGVPTVIAGKPNVGKSTLLNALLNEERAIVSEIAGTTRDTIEDELNIKGVNFRFIDTAGIRSTDDTIEAMGVERTYEKMKNAKLILYLIAPEQTAEDIEEQIADLQQLQIPYLLILNKSDQLNKQFLLPSLATVVVEISAKNGIGIEKLKNIILEKIKLHHVENDGTIVSNIRHLEALQQTANHLNRVTEGLNQSTTSDFLALDIRQAIYHLGLITGSVSTDDLLDNIFSKFCIGK